MPDTDTTPTPLVDTTLLPMSYLVAGSAHRGTDVRLVRCAAKGEHAESWMVAAGPHLVLASGQQIPAHPFHALRPPIQRQVAMSWDAALAIARRVRVG